MDKLGLLLILIISLLLRDSFASEWSTTSGGFCISKCDYHNDKNYFNWCYVTDPSKLYATRGDGSDLLDREGSLNPHMKWDYCVPSHGNAIVLGHQDGKPSFNNRNTAKTALHPPTECTSQCNKIGNQRNTCDTDTDNPQAEGGEGSRWFYCADEAEPLIRNQLTAINKFWCIDRCRKERREHHWCNTLYGQDHCSPEPNVGSMGSDCAYPCEYYSGNLLESDYYFCYTTMDNSTWEYCGHFDIPEEKKHTIEFTDGNNVCADYCQFNDDKEYEWCSYVYWEYNSTSHSSSLQKSWDYCNGSSSPGLKQTTIIIIAVVSVIGLIAIVVVIVCCLKNSGYSRTSSNVH